MRKKHLQENKVKVMLTSKGDWGVVPGERVATISGEEDNVNRAIEEMLAVVAVSLALTTFDRVCSIDSLLDRKV